MAAPYVTARGAPGDLSFRAAAAVYLAGGVVCHQQASRSFHLAGVQLPVCARCTGVYGGAALGLLASLTTRGWGRGRTIVAVASFPTLLMVAVEWLSLAQPSGLLRAAMAAPLGAGVSWVLVGAMRDDLGG